MELRDLRLVVTLADELHFGRAAARLHIGQPALSQQLRRLERRLGVQLFDRSTHHVSLTVAGRAFAHRARTVLTGVSELEASMREHRPDRHLRLGCNDPTYELAQVLTASLAPFLPDVELTELTVKGSVSTRRLFATGGIDLFLGLVGDAPELASMPLRSDRFGLWVGAEHPLAGREAVPISEVADLPVLVDPADDSPELLALVERMYAASGCGLRRAPSTSGSMLSAVFALARGGTPVVGPHTTPVPAGVAWVPFSDPHAHDSWHLAWRADDDRPVVARAVDAVRAVAADQGWGLLDASGAVIT